MYSQLGQSGTNLSQAHINVNMQLHPQPGVYSPHASLLIIIKKKKRKDEENIETPEKIIPVMERASQILHHTAFAYLYFIK